MNFNIEESRGYSKQSSEELGSGGGEEEEQRNNPPAKILPFPTGSGTASSSSNATSPFSYKNFLPNIPLQYTSPPGTDLSLGTTRMVNGDDVNVVAVEKEHMFDKVVTPSDVGKLNRLVIPKQHAEKYFPLDSSSNEKGLLLNFEDRNGKPWRFRYSYWNSSQSYVMTKGWSRFVKEKKLDAGDIVSFQRGVGEEGRHRLFIDWRRRPSVSAHLEFQNQMNVRWGNRLLYSLPHLNHPPHLQPPPPPQFSYAPHPYYQFYGRSNTAPYYVKPTGVSPNDTSPMVIDSVPVVQGRTVGKRLRLFGVNMDCPIAPSDDLADDEISNLHMVGKSTHTLISPRLGSSSSSSPTSENAHACQFPSAAGSSLQLRLPSGSGVTDLSKKGKMKIPLSFDLDV